MLNNCVIEEGIIANVAFALIQQLCSQVVNCQVFLSSLCFGRRTAQDNTPNYQLHLSHGWLKVLLTYSDI